MGPVLLGMRAELRLRWRAVVGLALLLGLVAGVALTAADGARRTETAYPRLLRWADAAQIEVMPYSGEPAPAYFAALARLPEVASISTAVNGTVGYWNCRNGWSAGSFTGRGRLLVAESC